jgi:DNA-binding PadR family transcriptional regulator
MTVRLVILGLLRERPLYGYEIKQIIEEHMSDWTSIAFGSIYFALDKLAEEQFVDKLDVEQENKRPARSVYQINKKGQEEFLRLLRESWQQMERQFFALDICLFFQESLPLVEIKAFLQQRVAQLEGTLTYLNAHQQEALADQHAPRSAVAIFEHSRVHFQAELAWTRDLLAQVERGEFR